MDTIKLFQACDGVILEKTAAGKSPHTIADYRNSFKKLQTYFEPHTPFAGITRADILAFFVWLQDSTFTPGGIVSRGEIKLSPKTIFNIHTALSVLWNWGVAEGYAEENIIQAVKMSKPKLPVIETFSRDEIEAMLKTCERSNSYNDQPGAPTNTRPTAARDRAIILTLLSSGIRASELCRIRLADLDMTKNSFIVTGKGRKQREVRFGKRTSKALWRLSIARLQTADPNDLLFVVGSADDARPLDRHVLCRLLARIGQRAGIKNVHPHRFRHTFAITYLRNGGDMLTLQALLGHSSLEMVKVYARIASTDCGIAHAIADPVDNWQL